MFIQTFSFFLFISIQFQNKIGFFGYKIISFRNNNKIKLCHIFHASMSYVIKFNYFQQNTLSVQKVLLHCLLLQFFDCVYHQQINIPKDSLTLRSPAGQTFVRFILLLLTSFQKIRFWQRREENPVTITQNPLSKLLIIFVFQRIHLISFLRCHLNIQQFSSISIVLNRCMSSFELNSINFLLIDAPHFFI